MSLEWLALIGLFLALLALPLVPGIRELLRPRDDRPLEIDLDATVDPRQEGRSFRDSIRPLLARAGEAIPFRGPVDPEGPAGKAYEVHRDLLVPADGRGPALLVALGKAEIGERARLDRLYVQGDARLGADVRVRSLAADGTLVLGPGCVVERWLDVEGAADVGAGARLGHQARVAGRLRLGPRSVFRRLWGLPVTTEAILSTGEPAGTAAPDAAETTLDEVVMWSGQRLTMPRGFTLDRDLVARGEVYVSAGNRVRGSIKAYGQLHLGSGAQVDGNLICRRGIRIDGPATIRGNVFAEGDIVIGPGTTIGQEGGFKSVYALGHVELSANVRVFGWVVAEGSGVVSGS